MTDTAVAEKAPETTTEAPRRKMPVPSDPCLKEADYARNRWVLNAPEGAIPSDVLIPGFWAHLAPKLRFRDRIEVWADNGTWVVDVVVLKSTRDAVTTMLLSLYDLDAKKIIEDPMSAGEDYMVEYKGTTKRWCVIALADGRIVHEGDENKEAALLWLRERRKADR